MPLLMILSLLITSKLVAFTFEDLRDLIERKQLTQIDQVIELLPEEYRRHYTLMYESQSLQGASPLFPRAILFGKRASLILTFAGHPDFNGYESLELVQYRPESHRFEYRRIHFSEGGESPPIFSEANPSVCKACHTERLRPKWDNYPSWPGAYGSRDDFPTDDEARNLKSFWERSARGPRYRHLIRPMGSMNSPYETKRQGRLAFRPNLHLTTALFAHQARSYTESLKALPQGDKWARLFAISLLRCEQSKINWPILIKNWYGPQATATLGPWKEPDQKNGYAYLLYGAKVNSQHFSMALSPSTPETAEPYFYSSGVGKDYQEPFSNGLLTLSDQVMTNLLVEWKEKIPGIETHLVDFPWLQNRFKKNAEDHEISHELDELLKMKDHVILKEACELLERSVE